MRTPSFLLAVAAHAIRLGAVAALAVAPPVLNAQSAVGGPLTAISAAGVTSGDATFRDMVGARLTSINPLRSRPLSVRVSISYVTKRRDGFGAPCAGLLQPGTCLPEPLRINTKLTTLGAGLGWQVLARPTVRAQLLFDANAGFASTRMRGTTSGRALKGGNTLFGGSTGVDLFWWPANASRFGVTAGGTVSGFVIPGADDCVDCYLPFESGLAIRSAHVGVVLRGKPR